MCIAKVDVGCRQPLPFLYKKHNLTIDIGIYFFRFFLSCPPFPMKNIPLLLLFLLFPLSLLTGSVPLSPYEVWTGLWGGGEAMEVARFIVLETRLPAACTALLAGAALAVAGLVMQTLFSNPLADPSLLGVNSGASLGAACALLAFGGTFSLGAANLSGVLLTVAAAFAGACTVIALLVLCSRFLRGTLALLVAGVMWSFAISAVISLLSFYATADGVHSFVIWGLGDFNGVPLERLPLMALLTLVPSVWLLFLARPLNALLLGPDYAANLGVRVRPLRTRLLLLTGLLSASVTALCGPVSFIGLAVPHIARLLLRTADHRRLLPATLLLGADTALFSLIVSHLPGERGTLPLAAITPLLGVPVVLYILLKRK